MTNEELNVRIENGWIPVVRSTMEMGEWVEIDAGALRLAAPNDQGIEFVQVDNDLITATWRTDEIRWIAPTSLVVHAVPEVQSV